MTGAGLSDMAAEMNLGCLLTITLVIWEQGKYKNKSSRCVQWAVTVTSVMGSHHSNAVDWFCLYLNFT